MEAIPLCNGRDSQGHSGHQVQCSEDALKEVCAKQSSWKYVKQEKSEDMIHVLQFPYNGEPPRVLFISFNDP
jgi:hypothetical protein